MLERVLIAGSGGQGVLLIGKLLAAVAVDKVPHVTFFPAYGAEVRGGVSNCQVVLSSEEIASPLSQAFDSMILMNQLSLDKFLPQASPGCVIVANCPPSALPAGSPVLAIDATEQANRLGSVQVANFVMLGRYLAAKPLVPARNIEAGIQHILAGKSADLVRLNLKAFYLGLDGAAA